MNQDTIKGNWEEIKGKAKQKWALLGDDDFNLYLKGKSQEFAGKIQKTYGKNADAVNKEIKEFEDDCGCSSSDQAA